VMVVLPSQEAALATAGMELVLEVRGPGMLGSTTCSVVSRSCCAACGKQQRSTAGNTTLHAQHFAIHGATCCTTWPAALGPAFSDPLLSKPVVQHSACMASPHCRPCFLHLCALYPPPLPLQLSLP
jgi:hypothetical protein